MGGSSAPSTPLDIFPGAVCAYSYRRVRAAYAGAASLVRRDSDSAFLDIGFQANGDWDIPTYHTWIGASFAWLQRWYDQTGNGNDQVQLTAALQTIPHAPDYPANNVTGTDGQGVGNRFYTAADVASIQNIWGAGGFVIAVMEVYGGNESAVLSKGTQPNGWVLFCFHTGDVPDTDQLYLYWVGPGGTGATSYFTNTVDKMARGPKRNVLTCAWNSSTPATPAVITINGVTAAVVSQTGTGLSSEAGVMEVNNEAVIQGNTVGMNARLYELIAWKSQPSPAQLSALTANLIAYYGN